MVGVVVLIRHGETEWSRTGQHTGRTDLPLTEAGRASAAALTPHLAAIDFSLVLISPLTRAVDTAHLAGLTGETDPDLLEWDYGAYEGRRTADIRADLSDPTWTIWRDPIPPGATPGEQPEEVAVRCRRVLDRCVRVLAQGGNCALVAHGHLLRMLTATWLDLPAVDGRLFWLDASGMSALGYEYETRVIRVWNSRTLQA